MMPKAAAPLLVLLAGTASAQTKIDRPFYGEIGVALPTAHGSDPGAVATLGATFLRRHGLVLSGELRAMGYDTGDDAGPFSDDRQGELFSPLTFGLDARYQPHRGGFFVGAGLDGAQLTAANDTSASITKPAYARETGYGFSKRVYGIVRYQSTFDDLPVYRAFTVGVGLRF